MTCFVGATGLDIFDDAIQETSNIIVLDLLNRITLDVNNTSNYVYSTSNILIGRILAEDIYSSNYTDLQVKYGSNYTDLQVKYTSNYVKTTSNILVQRIRLLEGSEGSAGDPNADPPIPPIPPTGTYYILATLGALAAGATATGILITDLTTKVNNNAVYGSNYSDTVGKWGSNYTDKVGVWSSNYTDKIGIFGSNYTDKVGIFGSNYTDKIGIFGSNYTDKVGIFGSNYTDKIGIFGSNYSDKIGIFGSNYIDKVGIFGSNYTDKIGIFGSNYSDKIGIFGSNYARDKIGVYSSNYSELLGIFGSNYARDKIGVYSSNYTDLQVLYTSNYVARINTGKQDIINSIANQIIIGNGNGLTTTSTGLTFATNTLNATNLSISGITTLTGNVGIGTTASTPLHIYNTTSSLLRLQTGTTGKPSIEFSVGTLTDTITDYRIINDAYELKFQYQDNLVSYGATGSDIMIINDKGTTYNKPTYYVSGLGVKTPADPLYSLDVSGNCRYLSGNVGIGVEPSTGYRLNVAGDVNVEGIGKMFYVNNLPVVSSQWATSGTTIEYNGGSVGIGTSALSYKLNVNGTINATSLLVNGGGIDYNGLNNKPITLIPTTTNLQLATGYNFLIGGNVGIGTTNSATYKVDVNGTLNATNLLINGNSIDNKWITATDTTRIYYNTGNVGIGTTNPLTKLHINDTTTNIATLTIQNNFTSAGITATPTSTGTVGAYTYQQFTYTTGTTNTSYTITAPAGGLVCDILVVGAGGSGSQAHGGGGGAGAVIFMKDVNMSGGYTIKVGKGGVCEDNGVNGVGRKGNDTEIYKTDNITNKIVAEGGGGGGQFTNANGGSGGSGGGGDAYNVAAGVGGSATAYTPILDGITGIKYGNNGGNAFGNPGHGGGGGGAGGVGENATAANNSGNDEAERAHGGVGIKSATISSINYDFKTLFGTSAGGVLEADGFVYFGGGGGNGRWKGALNNGEGGNGGLGGGGKGGWGGGTSTPNGGKGYAGTANTGGGGGGGGDYSPVGGDGGSGVVIIRYLSPSSSASLELVRGTTTDANNDWKLGNYAGDFKIISSVSSVDTDRLVVSSAGNVGIATTNPANILQVGLGGRLRIANNTADQSVIGGDDVASSTSSRIELKGSTYVNFSSSDNGNIWYYARGFQLFYINNNEIMRMVAGGIYYSSSANLVSNNGRTQLMGRVGIGKAEDTTLILDVLGNSKMTGNLTLTGNLTVGSYIEATASILSKIGIYARNSFDALLYCDGNGVFLNFGDVNTGNASLFQLNSSGGATNFNSSSNRSIYFRTNIYSWLFGGTSGVSYNALNTSSWNVVSDQRIKENIKKANLSICYENVKNINLYRYNYINGFKNGIEDKTQLGYIAQQVQQVFPKSISRTKTRLDDKREIPDLCGIDATQINFTLFGAVKQLMKVVEKQSKRIKKLEEMLGIVDDDEVENDADEPYERIVCDEVDIDDIEPSEPVGV